MQEDFSGRRWEVTVTTATELRQQSTADKEQTKRQKKDVETQADAQTVLHALEVMDPDNHGVTFTACRNASGISPPRFGPAA